MPRVTNIEGNTIQLGDDLSSLEKVILAKIRDKPMTIGELFLILQEDKSDILETISIMELKGKITNVGGMCKYC